MGTLIAKKQLLPPTGSCKRFLQTVNQSELVRSSSSSTTAEYLKPLNYSIEQEQHKQPELDKKWSKHSMPEGKSLKDLLKTEAVKKLESQQERPKKKRRLLKPRKALITLSSNAVHHLSKLLDQPTPKMIRIGVRNRGCSGLTYHLEYVTEPGKFDEAVEQDGVKVLIDSKALFSIVGSEMDWIDDKLSSKFVFKNPNSKGTCGCGESFMV